MTSRSDGNEQLFAFADRGDYHESLEPIPEPHAFAARVSFGHGDHVHAYELAFAEAEGHAAHHHHHHHHGTHQDHGEHGNHEHDDHDHHYDGDHAQADALARLAATDADMDAHQRAHAGEIARRFTDRNVTTSQIVAFGLTGGLIPCPAAITVLLLCLQLKRIALAIAVVACFSIGVAATMVAAGVVAALGVRHVRKHWSGFDALARHAPYASVGLMILVALYMAVTGWLTLAPA